MDPLPLILQLCSKRIYVGISYLDPEFVGDDRKIVTGVFIQTAYQRFKLQNFHDFITFDAKTSGVCTFGWKLMMPTVIDQEGKLRTTAYCLVCAEDYGSMRFQANELIKCDPLLPSENKAIMTDVFFLPDHEINELIPSAKHFECQKHLVSSDCPNHWPAAEAAEGTRIMWEIVKAEFPEKQQKAIKQLKEKCPKFYDTYFVPTVQPKLAGQSFLLQNKRSFHCRG